MRNLIYAINISIDGCLDHTKMLPNEESFEFWTQLIRDASSLVYGRITYQLMVPYWPDVAKNRSMSNPANDFADAFDAVEKIVFSKSLDKAEDKKTRVVRTDLKDEILRLKQEPGKDMLLGGVDLPSQLIALNLVDEFLFIVNPVIAGGGRGLFEAITLPERIKLKLVDSKVFKSGHVVVRYGKE